MVVVGTPLDFRLGYGSFGGAGGAPAARVAHVADSSGQVSTHAPLVAGRGNNSAWGLEKHSMQSLYGYDVVADLAPGTRYDQVAQALGADGETVERPGDIGNALDRAFAAGGPYLVHVLTNPAVAYPRATTGA